MAVAYLPPPTPAAVPVAVVALAPQEEVLRLAEPGQRMVAAALEQSLSAFSPGCGRLNSTCSSCCWDWRWRPWCRPCCWPGASVSAWIT